MDEIMNYLIESYKGEFNTALMLSFIIYNIRKLNLINTKVSGLDLRKCEISINNSFKLLEYSIYFKIKDIIIKNNVEEHKDFVKSNIKKIIDDNYYKVYSDLTVYNVGKDSINGFMLNSWKDELYEVVMLHVFSNSPVEVRLESLRRSLNNNIESYKTHLFNKTINKQL